ncbi:D-sedoheptulose 7-phosphate isomerase [Saliniradius amylolyticus]|uniref:D-sedoheptulose 7-phosphate isomerase n=1 Tax=Saliniradius amylolyticus TaxID=2183582 RepID=A0A2S2E7K8_9ALTE|nr:SIS domain-containing protein [Saliniradius amylolyticus]AWL12937.1 D-sedoheptulose 7-phosphate isomerase [Saliniradius amylolyticus]
MIEKIRDNFTESIQTKIAAVEILPEHIERAIYMLVQALVSGNKILCCGNGGGAALAQHFAAILTDHYDRDRPSLPALAVGGDTTGMTTIANNAHFSDIFAKPIRALGQSGDVLLTIAAKGNSRNIINAMEAALSRDMTIIALSGDDGGEMAGLLGPNDVEIRIPSSSRPRIHETQLMILHSLCEGIEDCLFPDDSGDLS